MKRVLRNEGIQVGTDAREITQKWNEWSRMPENKEKFLVAQDRIQENLSYFGESTIFNKSMNETIRKTNFQALTGYVNGQLNKTLTDIGKVIGTIETGGKKGGWTPQRTDSAIRLGTSIVMYLGTVMAVTAMLEDDVEDPEIAKELAKEYVKRNQ